jgi:hypothetical protein
MGSQISGFGDIHQGDEVEHVFFIEFIETGALAVPDRPERSIGASHRIDFPSSIQ